MLNLAARLFRRIYPRLDLDYWRIERLRLVRAARPLLKPQTDRLRSRGTTRGRRPHLVVVPDHGRESSTWDVACGNLFFEIWQSAIEVLGADHVSLFEVRVGEDEHQWHGRLLDALAELPATHLIVQIEADPMSTSAWSWDVVADALASSWDGAMIGVMYDSAYEWLQRRARRAGRLMPNLLIADLCVPKDGFVRSGRFDVGPMTMPLSQASIATIDAYVSELPKVHEVTFIGTLYEYRVELLKPMRDLGVKVAINPHRPGAPDDEESSIERSTYLAYMAALAQSDLTVNFSLARGGPHEQYKIRVHEASLVGCMCLTDDLHRSRLFFTDNQVTYFQSAETLDAAVAERLSDRSTLRADQESARRRAHELSRTDFWGRIDDGLNRRRLPPLTGLRPPGPPKP